jgi:ATP-binding cassette subfamily F protein 3
MVALRMDAGGAAPTVLWKEDRDSEIPYVPSPLVHDGRLGMFDGDLDDYAALVLNNRRDTTPTDGAPGDNREARREQRKLEAEQRQRLASARKPFQAKLSKIEPEMAAISTQLRELDTRLADADFYHTGDANTVAATIRQRADLARKLETLEEQWLDLQTKLEQIA